MKKTISAFLLLLLTVLFFQINTHAASYYYSYIGTGDQYTIEQQNNHLRNAFGCTELYVKEGTHINGKIEKPYEVHIYRFKIEGYYCGLQMYYSIYTTGKNNTVLSAFRQLPTILFFQKIGYSTSGNRSDSNYNNANITTLIPSDVTGNHVFVAVRMAGNMTGDYDLHFEPTLSRLDTIRWSLYNKWVCDVPTSQLPLMSLRSEMKPDQLRDLTPSWILYLNEFETMYLFAMLEDLILDNGPYKNEYIPTNVDGTAISSNELLDYYSNNYQWYINIISTWRGKLLRLGINLGGTVNDFLGVISDMNSSIENWNDSQRRKIYDLMKECVVRDERTLYIDGVEETKRHVKKCFILKKYKYGNVDWYEGEPYDRKTTKQFTGQIGYLGHWTISSRQLPACQ